MVAGAVHTHLERRDAGSRDPRDLLVFEPVTEFEQDRLLTLATEAGIMSAPDFLIQIWVLDVDVLEPLEAVGG